jgi:hypothetical protein
LVVHYDRAAGRTLEVVRPCGWSWASAPERLHACALEAGHDDQTAHRCDCGEWSPPARDARDRQDRAVIDTAVIDTLRNAAEALSLACITSGNDTRAAELARIARDCLDAANALAARYVP